MDSHKRKNTVFEAKEAPQTEIHHQTAPPETPQEHHKAHPVLITLSILIPLIVLGVILYLNFLPFGYEKTYTIEVGGPDDTTGVFYLEQSSALGARQMYNEKYFRAVDGVVNVVYKPEPILRNVTLYLELEGEGVYFIKPGVNLEWDYDFLNEEYTVVAPHTTYSQFLSGEVVTQINDSFAYKIEYNSTTDDKILIGDINLTQDSKSIIVSYADNNTRKQIKYNLPDFYLGKVHEIVVGYNGESVYLFVDGVFAGKDDARNVDFIDIAPYYGTITIYSNYNEIPQERIEKDPNGCLVFDGKTRLVFANTSDQFEEGPFAVYVEWTPTLMNNTQQLIGHYNWEIWQDAKDVKFRIGRMYDQGPSYDVTYPVDKEFFNKTHNLLATYNPSNETGYIELYFDGTFAGRKEFGNESIWKDYGNQDLSLGWTPHNNQKSPYYKGSICNAKFSYKEILPEKSDNIELNMTEIVDTIKIPIFGKGNLNQVKISVSET